MQAAINPIILFPPLYSIFPEDNKDAPTNDKTIAAKVTIDFFSLKKISHCYCNSQRIHKMDDRSNTTCNILISYDKTERSKRTQQAQSENCFKIFIPYVKITFGKKSKNKQDNCSNSPTISQHFERRISNSQQAYGKKRCQSESRRRHCCI